MLLLCVHRLLLQSRRKEGGGVVQLGHCFGIPAEKKRHFFELPSPLFPSPFSSDTFWVGEMSGEVAGG